jgi:hypothetical protein
MDRSCWEDPRRPRRPPRRCQTLGVVGSTISICCSGDGEYEGVVVHSCWENTWKRRRMNHSSTLLASRKVLSSQQVFRPKPTRLLHSHPSLLLS